MSKKRLKRRNKKLKKEVNQLWDDYQSIGRESIDDTILLNDIVKLLAESDSDWFMRAIRAADLARIEQLKQELKEVRKDNREKQNELEHCYADGIAFGKKIRQLRAENEELKAAKVQFFLNEKPLGELIEF